MPKTAKEEAKAIAVGGSALEESRSVPSLLKIAAHILLKHKSHRAFKT